MSHIFVFVLLILMSIILLPQILASVFIDDALLKRSFQKLTDPQVYEHFIRPKGLCGDNSKNRNDNNWYLKPLELNMSLELYNYATVDERNSEYTFQFFLDLEWCDERLILQNKSELFPIFIKTDEDHMNTFLSKNKISNFKHEYQFEGGQYYIERLWHPSIFVSNNEQPGSIDYDGQSPNMARIDLDSGRIFLRKRKMLVINCLMDFSLFPFDRQHCSVHFESNVENSQKLVMRWREMLLNEDEANAQKLASKESSMWSLLFWASSKSTELNGSSNSVIKSHGSFRTVGFELVDINLSNSVVSGLSGVNFSRCSFDFTLQRQFIHHVLINYLPSTLIVTVSMTTFWLPIDSSPTRVLMAATTMLTMVTNFKLSRELLPTVTYLNVLDIWNLVCVTFIALSIIEYAVVSFIINTPKRQTTMHRIRKRSEKYRRHHQGSIRELQVSQTPQPSSNSVSKCPTPANGLTDISESSGFYERANFAINGCNGNGNVLNAKDLISRLPRSTSVSFVENKNFVENQSRNRNSSKSYNNEINKFFTKKNQVINSGKSTRRNSVVDINMSSPKGHSKSFLITSNVQVAAIVPMTPEQLSFRIDYWCRFLFPGAFFIFNLIYWSSVVIRKSSSETPKW